MIPFIRARWLLAVALAWDNFLSSSFAQDQPADIKIGLVQGMFRDVQPTMMQALAKPFREFMNKQTGYSGAVEIFPEALALAEKLQDKEVHLGVFHGFEFAWAQKKCPDLRPVVVTIPPSGKVQAFVMVRKDSATKKLADLTDENVLIPRGAKSHSLVFLAKARDGFEKSTAKPQTKLSMTHEDALNALVNNEAAAVLVDSAAWEGYQTLQPGACKQLRKLVESEEFPAAVIAYHKDVLSDNQIRSIQEGMAGVQKSATGKMLMMLWNLKGFQATPDDYQQQLDKILKAYPIPEKSSASAVRRTGGGSAPMGMDK